MVRYNDDDMMATKSPLASTAPIATLNFGTRATNRLLNLLGIFLFLIFGWLFLGITAVIHPNFFSPQMSSYWRLVTVPRFVLLMVIVVVLHEFVHGLAYWLVVRERPFVRPNFLYYYIAAPDWYIPQKQYIFIRLAPFILLTILGIILLVNAQAPLIHYLTIALPINAAGSINDFFVIVWLLLQKKSGLVQDRGPEITLYHLSP